MNDPKHYVHLVHQSTFVVVVMCHRDRILIQDFRIDLIQLYTCGSSAGLRFPMSPLLYFFIAGAVCTFGVAIVGLFAHVQKNVMSDPECVSAEVGRPKSKTATSMGLGVRAEAAAVCVH